MESYIKLTKHLEELQEQIKKIEIEKTNILMPLYEIENKYKHLLGDILPKNINSVKQRNLDLRITILEEEIKDLEIEHELKKNIIGQIENIKSKLEENKKEEEKVKKEIKEVESKLQERKEYVLNKMHEKQQIESKGDELQAEISKYYELLEKKEWEAEVINSTDKVIKKIWSEIEQNNIKLEKFLNDEELAADITELTKNNPEEERVIAVEENKLDETPIPLNEAEEALTTEKEKNLTDEELAQDITEPTNNNMEDEGVIAIEENNLNETPIHLSEVEEETPAIEKEKSSKERLEELLIELENLGENNAYTIPEEKREENHLEEQEKTSDDNEYAIEETNQETVIETHNNPTLESTIKEKKERVKLGVNIINLLFNYKKTVEKAEKLTSEVIEIINDNSEDLKYYDDERLRNKSLEIINQRNNVVENKGIKNKIGDLKKLKALNSSLDKTLDNLYLEDEYGTLYKPSTRK